MAADEFYSGPDYYTNLIDSVRSDGEPAEKVMRAVIAEEDASPGKAGTQEIVVVVVDSSQQQGLIDQVCNAVCSVVLLLNIVFFPRIIPLI